MNLINKFGNTINRKKAEMAFHQVRQELCELGLLDDGKYLDHIDLAVSVIPSIANGLGFIFDDGIPGIAKILGFEEGVIYLPRDIPKQSYIPGYTLTDVVRHEFAHAWAWLDRKFINKPWFIKAFGAKYSKENPFGAKTWRAFDEHHNEFVSRGYADDYVTAYAMSAIREDFAESFMYFLHYKNSLHRFKKRNGVYRKLTAIQKAVRQMARQLNL